VSLLFQLRVDDYAEPGGSVSVLHMVKDGQARRKTSGLISAELTERVEGAVGGYRVMDVQGGWYIMGSSFFRLLYH